MTEWCGYSRIARKFLDSKGVEYEMIDVDADEDAAHQVMEWNNGNRTVPTFEIDGAVYTNPSRQQLTELLKLI